MGVLIVLAQVNSNPFEREINLDANLVQLIVAVLIPVLTGLVTKYNLSTGWKQIISGLLVAAGALITNAIVEGGDAVFTLQTLYDAVLMYVIQIATYLGVYRPHDINAKLAPHSGIGSAETMAA